MNRDFLFIVLDPKIRVFISSDLSEDEKTVLYDSNEFKEIPIGHCNGFYDWLRNFSGHIIGVRYFPFEDSNFLLNEVIHLNYSKIDKVKGNMDIYFVDAEHCLIDEDISDDQKFGDNRIFKSSEGKLLLTFEVTEVKGELKLPTHTSIY